MVHEGLIREDVMQEIHTALVDFAKRMREKEDAMTG